MSGRLRLLYYSASSNCVLSLSNNILKPGLMLSFEILKYKKIAKNKLRVD